MGIGGSGCQGAAGIALSLGYSVSGCDQNLDRENLVSDLKNLPIHPSHSPAHLENIDLLIFSPAVLAFGSQNREVKEARKRKIPTLTWQEFVGLYLQKDKFVLAVSGTHGKSSTSGFLGFILEKGGFDPTVLLGAKVLDWGKNFRVGKGKYFVIEADEFNNNFFNYKPDIAVILSLEFDHPEFFKDFEQILESFEKFILASAKKTVVVGNVGDNGVAKLIKIISPKVSSLITFDNPDPQIKINLPGSHQLLNATAAFLVASILGISREEILKALNEFKGLERRLELVRIYKGAKIYDDYAHHPTEIEKTIEAAEELYPKNRLIGIFQPHMFSRTKALLPDFVRVLKNSSFDKIVISDIFAAREKNPDGVKSPDLVEAIGDKRVEYMGDLKKVALFLRKFLKKGDVCINMGAGDINKLAKLI